MNSLFSTRKALIVGGSGLLGSCIRHYDVTGRFDYTFKSSEIQFGFHFDLQNPDWSLLKKYDTVFLIAGIVDPKYCEEHPAFSHHVNVTSMLSVIEYLRQSQKLIVYTSSEYVYTNGEGKMGVPPSSELSPTTLYGRQKALVEGALSRHRESVVLRLPKLLSTLPTQPSILHGIHRALDSDIPLRVAADQVFSPINTFDVYRIFIRLLQGDISGTYNLGGLRSISRYDLAVLLARKLGVENKIVPTTLDEFDQDKVIPRDVGMESSLIYGKAGFSPQAIEDTIQEYVRNRAI